ncbi:MAG: hypothetical protein ABIQ06_00295 [Caldimonas sp.]
MALLGKAALAMWWDIAPEIRPEFEHWHSHEHFPERLGVPGFRRAMRWASAENDEGFFVLYELEDHGVLSSAPYAARLNAPTPWSVRMMPHHRHMVRSQCRVLESSGAATASHALTIRLSPAAREDGSLRQAVARLSQSAWTRPGVVGMHLLRHETPGLAKTAEQKIRGDADRVADWVVIVSGYDAPALRGLGEGELSEASLHALGAAPGTERHLYRLAHSATPADVC